MKIKVYQLPIEHHNKFMDFKFASNHGGITIADYELVFDGEVNANDMEDIFVMFNFKHPEGFTGHSLSVSDIVVVEGEEHNSIFYCDSFGWEEI